MGTFANSENPNEMPLWAVFHHGLHYLRIKVIFRYCITLFGESSLYPLGFFTRRPIVSIKIEEFISIQRDNSLSPDEKKS